MSFFWSARIGSGNNVFCFSVHLNFLNVKKSECNFGRNTYFFNDLIMLYLEKFANRREFRIATSIASEFWVQEMPSIQSYLVYRFLTDSAQT